MPEIGGAPHVDQFCAFRQVGIIEQVLRRDFAHVAAVGDPAVGVGEGELHCLDLQVLAVHRIDRVARDVELVHDAQHDQRGDALSVRWDFVHGVAGVILLDRRHPFRLVAGEVLHRQRAAVLLRMLHHRFRQLAAIEGIAVSFRDAGKGLCSLREHELLGDLRRATVRHEGLRKARLLFQDRYRCCPLVLHDRRHHVAARRQFDRRLQQVDERQLAEALRQLDPAGDHPGHRHRVPAALRDLAVVFPCEILRGPRGRRVTGSVEAVQLRAVPQDRERIAAEAAGNRFDDSEGSGCGDGGIDRVAALEHHA